MGSGVSKKPFSYVSLASNIPSRSPLPFSLDSRRYVRVYVCSVRVCLPACRENARVGLLYRCFLFYWNKFIAGLSYRPISSPLSINELFQPVFIVRFSNLSSNVIFLYIVKDQGKGILIVPSGKKGKKYA